MSNLTDFIGGSGIEVSDIASNLSSLMDNINLYRDSVEYIKESTTWVAPSAGDYFVIAIGGGGGGGARKAISANAAGGGSGYHEFSTLTLTNGENVVCTIGAGASTTPIDSVGGTGGTTTFGAYLSASGGTGGGIANGVDSVAIGGQGFMNGYDSVQKTTENFMMNLIPRNHSINMITQDDYISQRRGLNEDGAYSDGGHSIVGKGGAGSNIYGGAGQIGAGGGGGADSSSTGTVGGAGGNGIIIIFKLGV